MAMVAGLTLVAAACGGGGDEVVQPDPGPRMSITAEETEAVPGDIVYRYGDDLYIDNKPLGIETGGPARWRPGHPDEIVYVAHSDQKLSLIHI